MLFSSRTFWGHLAIAVAVLATIVGSFAAPSLADEPAVRETPLTPEEELATFELADNRLTVELVAAEPELDSPVAISWDGDGRMFVAEMIDYPLGPTAGRIRLVEDRDGDGRYEHATVFAEGLRFPNGVLAALGGVFVTAAPEILFLKDTDGDGKADEKRVVLTGFGEGNQQLRANGLTWGLDNWIYGANGRSDGQVRRASDDASKAVSIRGRDFRFRPDLSAFEATSGASQFGQASDDWGNRFLSWNTVPIRHALFDQAFLERNPRLATHAVRDIAEPSDMGAVFPKSPRPTTFNRERTDFYNALAGLTIYRGDVMGPEYRGNAFVGESLTNLVHRRRLMPEGPTFVSQRGDHAREFLAARDPWFHPVYLTTGPDGALYIVDFYRRWVEHPAFVAERLRAGVDWRQGTGHGRIWKVSRREDTWPPRPAPRLNRAATGDLVSELESQNGWRRDTAHRLLVERADPQAAARLRALSSESRLPQAKLHALSILDHLALLDDGTLLRAAEDGEPHVRAFALRLAAARLPRSQVLATALPRMADFPDSLVRFHLALALGTIDSEEKTAAMVKLADLENRDPVIPLAIAGSLGRSTPSFLKQLLTTRPRWRTNPNAAQMRFLTLVSATACASDDRGQLAACMQLLTADGSHTVAPGDVALTIGMAQGLADRGQSLRELLDRSPADQRSQLAPLGAVIAAARTMALDARESLDHRLVAIEALGLADSKSGKVLLELLGPGHDEPLQWAAARALAEPDEDTAQAMFARWQDVTTATRRALLSASLRSRSGIEALATALENEQVQARELDSGLRDGLAAIRDEALRARIKTLLEADAPTSNRREVVARFESLAKREGDRARGATVFEKNCLTCHSIQGRGNRVGPDLSGVGARARESLVVDLFDPSRELAPNYTAYTLVTQQGQVLTGLVASESAASVTLRRADGAQDIVPRAQIEELRGTGKSLMPEGLEGTLSETDVVDLLEFLARPDAGLFSRSE